MLKDQSQLKYKFMTEERTMPLSEALVKTTYQTQITHPNDKECENPVGYGSGFMVKYKNRVFFITADHVVHPDDHNCSYRTGQDYIVSIFNNVRDESNYLSTLITSLGGFYYMESFNLLKPEDAPELVDISLCIMKEKNFQFPFLTDEVRFKDSIINAGEQKFSIPIELLSEPDPDKMYFVYGKIRHEMKGIRLHRDDTLKEGLKFNSKAGDYYLFNTPELIHDYKDWAGLSGSPVISETGECVGVLCVVTENTKSIWVMPVEKVKILMDVAISQEEIEKNKAANNV